MRALVLVGLLASSPEPAGVGGIPQVRQWVAPIECPQQAWFDERLRTHARASPLDVQSSGVELQLTVKHVPQGFQLHMTVSGAGGSETRALFDNDCQALLDAAALLTVLAGENRKSSMSDASVGTFTPPAAVYRPFEPESERPEVDGESHGENVGRDDATLAQVATATPLVTETGAQSSLRWRVGAAMRAQSGLFRQLETSAEVLGLLGLGLLQLEFGLGLYWPRTQWHARFPDLGVRLWSLGPRVDLCLAPRRGRWSFPVCLGSEYQAVLARGVGVKVSRLASSSWWGSLLSAKLAHHWRQVGVFVAFSGVYSHVRPRFAVDGQLTVWPRPFGVRMSLGLSFGPSGPVSGGARQ